METVNLTSKQLQRLHPISLDSCILNSEATLYEIKSLNNNPELIKKFNDNDSKIFRSKILVIKELINKAAYLPKELVLPKKLFSLDRCISGYVMDYIYNNLNLSEILNSDIPLYQKFAYLKQVLKIIEKLEYVSCFNTKIYLGDIHAGNFIFDKSNNIVRAVDLDSSVFNNAYPGISFYLSFNLCTGLFKQKYPRGAFDNPIPNHNSSYLCFIYMLLKTISHCEMSILNLQEYFDYLEQLKKLVYLKK